MSSSISAGVSWGCGVMMVFLISVVCEFIVVDGREIGVIFGNISIGLSLTITSPEIPGTCIPCMRFSSVMIVRATSHQDCVIVGVCFGVMVSLRVLMRLLRTILSVDAG